MKQNVTETSTTVLSRWKTRFERSLAIYHDSFVDEHFDDLIAVLVTASFIEALLWIGIQLKGFKPTKARKTLTLNRLVDEAVSRGLVGAKLAKLLRDFADLRNSFAHDIDYMFDSACVDALETQLPPKYRKTLAKALGRMPGYQIGARARLVFMDVVRMTYESLRRAFKRRSRRTT